MYCKGSGSNRRHIDFQSTALPTELPLRKMPTDGADPSSQGFQACVMTASTKLACVIVCSLSHKPDIQLLCERLINCLNILTSNVFSRDSQD